MEGELSQKYKQFNQIRQSSAVFSQDEIDKMPAEKFEFKDQPHDPEKFEKTEHFWLSSLGFAVGYGNLWRFPYLTYKNGGAAFLIPYLISLFVIAVPLYMIETAYGQLVTCKLNKRYGVIKQKFWGVSMMHLFICFFTTIYYVTLMSWSFIYFFDSFKSPLPWTISSGEEDDQTTETTTVDGEDQEKVLWNKNYLTDEVLQLSDDITDTNKLVGAVTVCMFISYVCLYFAVFKGLFSTGKMAYVTCTVPYVILGLLMVKGLTLEGCGVGLKYLFKPDFSKIGDAQIWADAAIQILYSSGVVFGTVMYYGSGRHPEEKIVPVGVMVPLINSLTSILCCVVVFSFAGFISHKFDVPIDQVSDGGLDLAFTAFPGLISLFDKRNANWWSLMFFLMLVFLGIDSAFGLMDFQIQYLLDCFPAIQKKMRKEAFTAIYCLVCFVCSLLFCLDSGYYYFGLFDSYACGISMFVCLLLEVLFLGHYLGMDKLDKLMNLRTGEKIPTFVQICFMYIVPGFITIMLLFSIFAEFSKDADPNREWPIGLLWAARLLFIIPIVAVPLGMLCQVQCDDVFELIMRDDKVWMDGNIKRSASFRHQEKQKELELNELEKSGTSGNLPGNSAGEVFGDAGEA